MHTHFRVLKQVFGCAEYLFLFVVTLFLLISLIILVPQHQLLGHVLASDSISLIEKLTLAFALLGSLTTNYSVFGVVFLLLNTLLFSCNVTVFVYYLRRMQKQSKGNHHVHLTGVAGFIAGLFGIGCAACGSIILTALLSSIGATGLLLFLPFHGSEFAVLGTILLLVSIHIVLKRSNDPAVCRID